MAAQSIAMHVARILSSHVGKDGRRREYESRYLRRTYREAGKVKHETLANLSALPDPAIEAGQLPDLAPARPEVARTHRAPAGKTQRHGQNRLPNQP